MIQLKREIGYLLLPNTKNCATFIKRTHTKPEETLQFELNKPKETFSFKPPIAIESSWMLGLTNFEVFNSIFKITEENNKFETYTDRVDEFSFAQLREELEAIVKFTDISPEDLEDDRIGPHNIDAYWKLQSEKLSTYSYIIFILA